MNYVEKLNTLKNTLEKKQAAFVEHPGIKLAIDIKVIKREIIITEEKLKNIDNL